MEKAAILFLMLTIVSGAVGSQHPARRDIVKDGFFLFPQTEATVLHTSRQLRLSAWNNDTILYVQAILWNDDSNNVGTDRNGALRGDTSSLHLDVDASESITPRIDRCYTLDPWPCMNGMYYSIALGESPPRDKAIQTPLRSDSSGTGSICYVRLADNTKIRIDSYVIPINELGREIGDKIRILYRATSAVPEFYVGSAQELHGRRVRRDKPVSQKDYHAFQLMTGKPLSLNEIRDAWSEERPAFRVSKPVEQPKDLWNSRASVDSGLPGVSLSHNSPVAIREEVTAGGFLAEIAAYLGIDPADATRVQIKYDLKNGWTTVQQNGVHPAVFRPICEAVGRYIRDRKAGHTREYVLASFKELMAVPSTNDQHLFILLRQYPYLPTSWLRKDEVRSPRVAPSGSEFRFSYYLVDGEIAWVYEGGVKRGIPTCRFEKRIDAKEYDPRYESTIEGAEREARRKMSEEGIRGLGSVHAYWRFKKEYLKKRGIDWRSPAELNPNVSYD